MTKRDLSKVRPRVRVSRCRTTGKVRYPDGRAAVQALHKAANVRYFAALDDRESRRRECRHYECPHCSGWHLTSIPDWVSQAA